ncbi:MAG: tRNA-(ms[2]io[6]A)-hydroxylase [Proteobacteria bacterium]|nr:tRNA-(ms[2]io[6]A)-hydroxylase [Pseudomonadota bacterium]
MLRNSLTQLDEIIKSLPLLTPTCSTWSGIALNSLDEFIADHASCERKAHASAMMMVNRYPDYPELQRRMISLALEELIHFQQLFEILTARNIRLPSDQPDPYVKSLMSVARDPKDFHLLDRLMIAAVIEARSAERFCLFAAKLPEGDLKDFYVKFAVEEARHFPYFIETAHLLFPSSDINLALDRVLKQDALAVQSLPILPTVH